MREARRWRRANSPSATRRQFQANLKLFAPGARSLARVHVGKFFMKPGNFRILRTLREFTAMPFPFSMEI